ncbi:MAG: MFS transporter [Deltaproteobacteria bacterium]|nr:MFS transporter [Deltaproteobacteria bacterium]
MGKTKFYGWKLVTVLWVIYLINIGFCMYGGIVVNTYMLRALEMERKAFGLGMMLFALIGGLQGFLIAHAINKRGIRFTLCLGSVMIACGGLLMYSIVNRPWQYFLVFGILMGSGVGFGSVLPVQTGITLWFSKKKALALSIALTAAGVGGFISVPILTRIMEASPSGWKMGWLFLSGLAFLAVAVSFFFVKNKPSDLGQFPDGIDPANVNEPVSGLSPQLRVYQTTDNWTLKQVFGSKSIWLIFIGAVGFNVPWILCTSHGVIHFIDKGFAPAVASMSIGLLTLCSIVGRLLGGALGDRIEPKLIWCIAMLIMLPGVLTAMLAVSKFHIYLYAILLGIGFGASFVSMSALIGNYYGADTFASVTGVLMLLLTITVSSVPLIGGWIFDVLESYNIAFIGVLILCAAGIAALIAAKPGNPSKE